MLDFMRLVVSGRRPFATGAELHHAALVALHAGRRRDAERDFERAAERYRGVLAVEELARLRVHQLMMRVLSGAEAGHEREECLEVERRLSQLDTIEALEPPFELVEARSLLGAWLERPRADHGLEGMASDPGEARA